MDSFFPLLFNYMCVFVCGYIHMSMDILAHRGQRRKLYHLELKFREAVSHPVWVLGPKLGSLQEHYTLLTAVISQASWLDF